MTDISHAFEVLAPRLSMTLIHSFWEGAVIASMLWLTLRWTDRASARLRYAFCCLGLATLIAACVVTFLLLAPAHSSSVSEFQTVMSPNVSSSAAAAIPDPSRDIPPRMARTIRPMRLVVLVWAGGVAAVALWHIAGWMWLHSLNRGRKLDGELLLSQLKSRLGVTRAIRLFENASLDVPAVLGVVRPIILIPMGMFNDLSPAQVEAILAHELAHIRRHDYLVNLMQAATEALLFYHPATWWISAQIRREREHCCDDVAASVCEARTYASALLALEERRMPTALALVAATGGTLVDRVRRLLKQDNRSQRRPFRSVVAALIALACLVIPIAVVAQTKGSSSTTKPSPPAAEAQIDDSGITADDLKPVTDEYRIGKNDLVQIDIIGLLEPKQMTRKVLRVTANGNLSLPYIGAIKIVGLTKEQAAPKISKEYKNANLAIGEVSVTVVEARGNTFRIMGAVGTPGQFAFLDAELRLVSALSDAKTQLVQGEIVQVVRQVDDIHTRTIKIPSDALMARDPRVDIMIHRGDLIIVNQSPTLSVVITKDSFLLDGKPIDLMGLRQRLDQLGKTERAKTRLSLKAAAPDITVDRYFQAERQLRALAYEFDLEKVVRADMPER